MITRIGVLGYRGRMGELVCRLIETEFGKTAQLAAKADQGDPLEPLLGCDVVIDFSSPAGMRALATAALGASGVTLPAVVVGSTGWKLEDRKPVEELAKKTPVLMSSNFSTGVLALIDILKQASPLLEKLGYTPIIRESHHRHKKDSPSGTALSLQRAISPAGPGNVQTMSVRAGEVIGDHEVTFYGVADHITIGHFAQDRSIFARGAIEGALWVASLRGTAEAPGTLLGTEAFFNHLKAGIKK